MTILLVTIFGLCVGSFLNAAIWRLREGISILADRSMCPHCGTVLAWKDLVPIFSYLVLGGACRTCKAGISLQYPIVEVATAALFLATYLIHPVDALLIIRDWLFVAAAMILFVYDLRWKELPDLITIPSIAVVFVLSSLIFPSGTCELAFCAPLAGWAEFLLAGAVGAGFFLAQYVISRGKWIGDGDIFIGALMGVLLGFPGVLVALFLSYMIGAMCSIGILMARKATLKSEIPFAPFLLASTLATLLFDDRIYAAFSLLF